MSQTTPPAASAEPTCSRVPTREDAPIVDSSWDFEDGDDYDADTPDDDDDDDCGMYPEDGVWTCGQIGSEPCEFCPNRKFLGTIIDDYDDDSENANMEARDE